MQVYCNITGCESPHHSKGFCNSHRRRFQRYGDPLGQPVKPTVGDRFWSKVDKNGPLFNGTPCWLWTASQDGRGYGQFRFNGKMRKAHRYAYELGKGPIQEGLAPDHLCRTPLCVNWDHLEAVTQRENLLRGMSPSAQHARKTHCPQGHPYDLVNTRFSKDGAHRFCRECTRMHSQARRS